jgi:ATP-dependent helicase HepA
MVPYRQGQRWISETEPELGLGTIVHSDSSQLEIRFPAAGELRRYACDNAPLKRVRFRPGDTIRTRDGAAFVVTELLEQHDLITYLGHHHHCPEAELNDTLTQAGPEDRLAQGSFDSLEAHALRCQARRYQHHQRRSPVRGFIGARIDLIPHQLFIAHEVASRHAPRVLLSDEVGLGKTIEACLILHRLLVSGRVRRALLLVPESLVHQWFIEMHRRFNLRPAVFDEERCVAIEAGHPGTNPFLDDQLILCSLGFLSQSAPRAQQVFDAPWDLLIVDEAHHLHWTPQQPSPEYQLVQHLGQRASGLLLLTATPEQLGPESHFARLRLLDPDRFDDYASFASEAANYRPLAEAVERLEAGLDLDPPRLRRLLHRFPQDAADLQQRFAQAKLGDPGLRKELVEDLLDFHGPGRVVLRNTRAAMQGFPQRRVHLAPLPLDPGHDLWIDRLSTEFAVDAGDTHLLYEPRLDRDPRVLWLARLLQSLAAEKVLLICTSPRKVLALEAALRQHITLPAAVFHEGLSLLQRDRNAAWFAEEDGAQLLICSEIGSEGRNFQFAHHLVLFDLPINPELLEQRIGRLDRIGQSRDIHLHVPFLPGSPQEVLTRWHHQGLNAFQHHLEGGNELFRLFGSQVHDLALETPALTPTELSQKLSHLLAETARAHHAIQQRLAQGRDRLLELNSFRPHIARRLIEDIRREDRHAYLEAFMLEVFEAFGVHAEELGPRTYRLDARGAITDAFPSIPRDGLVVTLDRARAVSREDVAFLTWDHPMVSGALDLLLGTARGNCAFGAMPDSGDQSLLLEAWFVLESVADTRLHVDRFLPITPLRAVVDHHGRDLTDHLPKSVLDQRVRPAPPYRLLDDPKIRHSILPAMLQAAHRAAKNLSQHLLQDSLQSMRRLLDHEIHRLERLQALHGHVRPQEIELSRRERQALTRALQDSRVRLDSARLVWKGPEGLLRKD